LTPLKGMIYLNKLRFRVKKWPNYRLLPLCEKGWVAKSLSIIHRAHFCACGFFLPQVPGNASIVGKKCAFFQILDNGAQFAINGADLALAIHAFAVSLIVYRGVEQPGSSSGS
jgi:hypothetical protein